jgi:YidC/Oxa1 family membrane protein insertase
MEKLLSPIVFVLFNLLILIYAFVPGHDFGIAIIILTILVRLLVWPLVSKQLHSQRAMQALAPELARIKKEAKGDRQKEGLMTMEMYKEKGISPFASLTPLFIQLPLLFALFFVLRDILNPEMISKLTYGPLKELDAIKNILADSSHFKPTLLGLVDLTKPNVVLAFLAGAFQYIQTKQIMPKNPSDPNAKAMAITTIIFPVLTVVFALSFSAALSLYWAMTSVVAIVQQKLILDQDLKEMEAKK